MKKALVVGINYSDTISDNIKQLYGCVNDAKDIKKILKKLDYKVLALLDTKATRKNILESFKWLLEDSSDIYLHFSGHGKNIHLPCIITSDYKTIFDYEFDDYLFSKIGKSKLRISLDCCIQIPLMWKLLYSKVAEPVILRNISSLIEGNRDIIIISGSGKTYDKIIDGERKGLLTHNLLRIIGAKKDMGCDKLLQLMTIRMEKTGSFPLIFFGKEMDIEVRFI